MSGGVPDTEFSRSFVTAMEKRMAVSYFKYGPVADAFPHRVNALASLDGRLRKYRETGNTEWLVDAANFAMIEFMHPAHPHAHFRGTDSHESPGRVGQVTGRATHAKNKDVFIRESHGTH